MKKERLFTLAEAISLANFALEHYETIDEKGHYRQLGDAPLSTWGRENLVKEYLTNNTEVKEGDKVLVSNSWGEIKGIAKKVYQGEHNAASMTLIDVEAGGGTLIGVPSFAVYR